MVALETRESVAPDLEPGSATEDELRTEVVASLKRKRKFWEDLAAYVGVNGVLWLIWALADRSVDGALPWPAWVTLIWGFLLLLDGFRAFGRLPRGGPITEAEIQREIHRRRSA